MKWQSKGFSTSIWVVLEMTIKWLFYLNLNLLECQSKGFSTSIWVVEMSIKGLLYFDLNCWNVDQRTFLLRFRLLKYRSRGFSNSIYRSRGFSTLIWTVEISIKKLFYFDLDCWNVDQRASLLRISIKGLFYFNLDLLECRLKGFSTSI